MKPIFQKATAGMHMLALGLAIALAGCSRQASKVEEIEQAKLILKDYDSSILVMPAEDGLAANPDTLTAQDAVAIADKCPAVEFAVPQIRVRAGTSYGEKSWIPVFIYGTTPEWLDVRQRRDFEDGGVFTDREVQQSIRVCVIGQSVKRELFNHQPPVGKKIYISDVPYEVVGILKARGTSAAGLDSDDLVLIPRTTVLGLQPRINIGPLTTNIAARARTTEAVPDAVRQITGLLRERHGLKLGEPDDFMIRDMTEMKKAFDVAEKVLHQK